MYWIYAGDDYTNYVIVTNAIDPVAYQWQFNGVALAGQTNATLRIPAVHSENAGPYAAVVCNSFGCVTSSAAILTVLETAPYVDSWTNTIMQPGSDCLLWARAYGPKPLEYR